MGTKKFYHKPTDKVLVQTDFNNNKEGDFDFITTSHLANMDSYQPYKISIVADLKDCVEIGVLNTNLSIQEIYNKVTSISYCNGKMTHGFAIAVICDVFNLSKEVVEKQLSVSGLLDS